MQSVNDECLPVASAKAKKKLEEVIDLLDDEPESESQDLRGSPQPVSAPRVRRSAIVAIVAIAVLQYGQRRVVRRTFLSMFCGQKVCLLYVCCSNPCLHCIACLSCLPVSFSTLADNSYVGTPYVLRALPGG